MGRLFGRAKINRNRVAAASAGEINGWAMHDSEKPRFWHTPIEWHLTKGAVISTIMTGGELEPHHLQVILAVLHGETDEKSLLDYVSIPRKTKYAIAKNVKTYKAILYGERPQGSRIRSRDIQVAKDFQALRGSLDAKNAYAKLAEESMQRYGITLGVHRVKSSITKGRRYIEEDAKGIEELKKRYTEIYPDKPIPI